VQRTDQSRRRRTADFPAPQGFLAWTKESAPTLSEGAFGGPFL